MVLLLLMHGLLVSLLVRLLTSSTPIGIIVIDARATKDASDDFPNHKCATATQHRLNAVLNDVIFPINTYSTS